MSLVGSFYKLKHVLKRTGTGKLLAVHARYPKYEAIVSYLIPYITELQKTWNIE